MASDRRNICIFLLFCSLKSIANNNAIFCWVPGHRIWKEISLTKEGVVVDDSELYKLIFCIQLFVSCASGLCNVCQSNRVACVNSTSFYLCFGDNIPHMDTLYHCKDGFECTEFNAICLQANALRPPSCGSTSLCGQCSASTNYVFACLSRNTFQMCLGASRPYGQIGDCPTGFVCDASNPDICVNPLDPHTVTCDIVSEQPESSTTISPTTSPLPPSGMCAQYTTNGLYPTTPRDPYCKRYIYCNMVGGTMNGREHTCPTGTYYNIEMAQCSLYKPAYCI